MTDNAGPRVAAILLAAGTASRYRSASEGALTKLVAELDGKPLVRHAAEAALASRARPLIVVTGHARDAVAQVLAGLPAVLVHNADYATGLASSLKTGVAALPADCDGALILLGDMPRIAPALIDLLIDAFGQSPNAEAVVPLHAGERGNPALVGRSLFGAIGELTGDQGARKLFAGRRIVDVPIDDSGVTIDVDTPAALAELSRK